MVPHGNVRFFHWGPCRTYWGSSPWFRQIGADADAKLSSSARAATFRSQKSYFLQENNPNKLNHRWTPNYESMNSINRSPLVPHVFLRLRRKIRSRTQPEDVRTWHHPPWSNGLECQAAVEVTQCLHRDFTWFHHQKQEFHCRLFMQLGRSCDQD